MRQPLFRTKRGEDGPIYTGLSDECPSTETPRVVPTESTRILRLESVNGGGTDPYGDSLHLLSEDRPASHKVLTYWNVWDWFLGTNQGQLTLLGVVAAILIIAGTCVWAVFGGNEDYDDSWAQSLWFSWGMFFDPGTEMGMRATEGISHKWVAVIFSIFGFLFNLTFLGTVVDLVKNQLDVWQKTRNRVVANGHTVLLGWTETTLFLLKELTASLENRGAKTQIVVLANRDSVDMMSDVQLHFPRKADLRGQAIVCRCGNPTEGTDLDKISVKSAEEIIILGKGGNPEESDNEVIQSVMALANLSDEPSGNIICEVKMFETASVIDQVMERAEGLIAPHAVTRLLCLQATHPLIANVFKSLLTFEDGEELYLVDPSDLKMSSPHSMLNFRAACFAAHKCDMICIGVKPFDSERPNLVPADMHQIRKGDRLVVLARHMAGQEVIYERPHLEMKKTRISLSPLARPKATNTIIVINWAAGLGRILLTLASYLPRSTTIHILAAISEQDQERRLKAANIPAEHGFQFVHHTGSTRKVEILAKLPLGSADVIMVLSHEGSTASLSDSACLATTLTLRELLKGTYSKFPECRGSCENIICEVKSVGTQRVFEQGNHLKAQLTNVTFFRRTALEAGILAVASADRAAFNVLLTLLHPNCDVGSVNAVPVGQYLSQAELSIEFSDLWERVRRREELLLGWKLNSGRVPVLNPEVKSGTVEFESLEHDHIIVISKQNHTSPDRDREQDLTAASALTFAVPSAFIHVSQCRAKASSHSLGGQQRVPSLSWFAPRLCSGGRSMLALTVGEQNRA
eukprot:CAMPEP_0171095360 /NCGR_PEP_ID=MMETSP0766_2-20121228/43125_1 /TAXON_ID=439317 /ORGANISM="Gambierdiscus australes, Strain CAWD 149" /LENGTH=803 /DNA_ID=CAMNT_0011554157 /DNA_START=48 /DNA_END=2456 /DNA_ORIENTATION=+